jgi:hypothetical protein
MSSSMNPRDFATFLEDLATTTPDSSTIIVQMTAKLKKEREAEVERKLSAIYRQINLDVVTIRRYKKHIEAYKKDIANLKEKAVKVLKGEDD